MSSWYWTRSPSISLRYCSVSSDGSSNGKGSRGKENAAETSPVKASFSVTRLLTVLPFISDCTNVVEDAEERTKSSSGESSVDELSVVAFVDEEELTLTPFFFEPVISFASLDNIAASSYLGSEGVISSGSFCCVAPFFTPFFSLSCTFDTMSNATSTSQAPRDAVSATMLAPDRFEEDSFLIVDVDPFSIPVRFFAFFSTDFTLLRTPNLDSSSSLF
mmetsp:Transcript_19148/g.28596  ORF Transcript_19148/g.28596 Transcript_19148/m.28596 type:complete len:218 (-) Transcript_19148:47-700(-)